MVLSELEEKVKVADVDNMDAAKKALSKEELIYCIARKKNLSLVPGSEHQIADIIDILASNGLSVRHSLMVLDTTKEVIPFLAKIEI